LKKEEMKAEEKLIPPAPVAKKGEEEKKSIEEGRTEKLYVGRKLSLDFKDADVKNILRLIAEVSNLNIIAGDDVAGKITMRLVDVPWDQALEIILQSKSLGMTRIGNVVRIAPREALKREIQAELEARRVKERVEDLVVELIPVNYATAEEIIKPVKNVMSERGVVEFDRRTNTLIIKDISGKIPAVKNLVKSLDTKTPMVLIEARIIEANLTFQRELGVRWGFLAVAGKDGGKQGKVGGGMPGTGLGGANVSNVVNLPAQPKVGTAGIIEFLFTSTHGLRELDVAISAHENQGELKVISSPKIATLDNTKASILQGLSIPYPQQEGEGAVTTVFKDALLKLIVTPHVTHDGYIKMSITVNKDAPDLSVTGVDGLPSIDKKEAITEVLIKDGGVVVIGGIYTIEKSEGDEGIPLFGKIPLLGWLFKRETKEDKRKDLLIFISPKILKEEI